MDPGKPRQTLTLSEDFQEIVTIIRLIGVPYMQPRSIKLVSWEAVCRSVPQAVLQGLSANRNEGDPRRLSATRCGGAVATCALRFRFRAGPPVGLAPPAQKTRVMDWLQGSLW